jgi:hypothetical protein
VRTTITLPQADGTLAPFTLREPPSWHPPLAPFRTRIAFAAAHVVCDPRRDVDVLSHSSIDWDATLAYRRHLWRYGFGVAEAMDTAQRGSGLDWPAAQDLIARALAESRAVGGTVACGVGTDQLAPHEARTLLDVEHAYTDQLSFVERHGGRAVLMASRALTRIARSPDDYARVYGNVLRQVGEPVIIHWLGEMFDPALAGYWGSRDLDAATDACVAIIDEHRVKIDGIKLSLLDAQRELDMRRRLPPGVRMYTGDDFNFSELIEGDGTQYSDALLGILDPIAPAASAALQALDSGDIECYRRVLQPTVPLSRHIFRAPTYAYKTGIVFLAYLNGHQSHFRMLAGAESARSVVHLAEIIPLADAAGLIDDPELAAARARAVFAVAGIE